MKNIVHILFFIISFNSLGQDSIAVNLKDSVIRIGEQTQFQLQFYYKTIDSIKVTFPEFDNYLTNEIEIINRSEVETKPLDSTSNFNFVTQQSFIITSFDPNKHTTPVLEITHFDSVYKSKPYTFIVNTVDVDTTKGITDIKPIYEVDYPVTERISDLTKEYWYWFLIIILLIVIIILLVKYKNRPVEEKPEIKVIIPAHIKALKVLNELKKNNAWESDNKKMYYSSLTDAVRLYLEDRYKILALEKTTREIIAELKYTNISVDDKYFLREILKQADFVKFAKFTPSNDDGLNALNKSFEFVERTKENEITETKSTNDNVE